MKVALVCWLVVLSVWILILSESYFSHISRLEVAVCTLEGGHIRVDDDGKCWSN